MLRSFEAHIYNMKFIAEKFPYWVYTDNQLMFASGGCGDIFHLLYTANHYKYLITLHGLPAATQCPGIS